jgi:hypothetical protein
MVNVALKNKDMVILAIALFLLQSFSYYKNILFIYVSFFFLFMFIVSKGARKSQSRKKKSRLNIGDII